MKTVRLKLLILLFATMCFAQSLQVTVIVPLADITGTGASVPITATSTYARWVQIVCPSTNSANVYWGDSTTSTTKGALIAAGGGQFIPAPTARSNQPSPYGAVYDLSTIYLYISSGDKVKITYQAY